MFLILSYLIRYKINPNLTDYTFKCDLAQSILYYYLKDLGRAKYYPVTDMEAVEAFARLSRLEGIIPVSLLKTLEK